METLDTNTQNETTAPLDELIVGVENVELGSSPAAVDVDAPHVPPAEDVQKRLVAQAEFYFSDENILKDTFLLKHIRKDKEGYVSLKLLASFRRLQRISKDWRDLAWSVERLSKALELNEKKTKVKRVAPLPDWDKSVFDRTVVGINFESLAVETTTDNVKKHFAKCGEVVLVRILQPGKKVPTDLTSFVKHHPELTSHVCVLVEYKSVEDAQRALKEIGGKEDWRGLQVLPLKKLGGPGVKVPAITVDEESPRKTRAASFGTKGIKIQQREAGDSSGSEALSATNSPKVNRRIHKKSNSAASVARPIPVPGGRVKLNEGGTPTASPEFRRKHADESPLSCSPASLGSSPWVRKRVQMESEGNSPQLAKNLITVTRQPYGPDGTKGFNKKTSVIS